MWGKNSTGMGAETLYLSLLRLAVALATVAASCAMRPHGEGSGTRRRFPLLLGHRAALVWFFFAIEGSVRLGGCAAQGAGVGTVKAAQKISALAGGGPALDNEDYFGRSVASVGDVDGDLVTDICVGAVRDDDGGSNHGAVYVLFLNTNGTVKESQKVSSIQGGLTASGVSLDNVDLFGASVASVGDLDGDAVPDICVGAYLDDDGAIGTNGQNSNVGAVYMLFLNTNGTVKASQKISSTQGGLSASGVSLVDNDQFGRSIAAGADFDGDSVADICVGAPFDASKRGAVYMLFLNINGTVKASQEISSNQGGLDASGVSLEADDWFGFSVAVLGDFGGSVTDICVGANLDNDGGDQRGAVYVLFLNTNGTVKASRKISSTEGGLNASGVSLEDLDGFGVSVASVGDVDGDTVTEICVGAYRDDDGGNNRGAVYVLFLNSNGTVKASQKISSTEGGLTASGVALDNSDFFGVSVASVGDFDGDTVTDICVGVVYDDDSGLECGAVYVIFLEGTSSTQSQSGAPTGASLTSTLLSSAGIPTSTSSTTFNSTATSGAGTPPTPTVSETVSGSDVTALLIPIIAAVAGLIAFVLILVLVPLLAYHRCRASDTSSETVAEVELDTPTESQYAKTPASLGSSPYAKTPKDVVGPEDASPYSKTPGDLSLPASASASPYGKTPGDLEEQQGSSGPYAKTPSMETKEDETYAKTPVGV